MREALLKAGDEFKTKTSTGLSSSTVPGCWHFRAARFNSRPYGRRLDRRGRSGAGDRRSDRRTPPDARAAAHRRGLPCCQRHGAAPIRSGPRGASDDADWIRLKATADTEPTLFTGRISGKRAAGAGRRRFQSRISRHSQRRQESVRSPGSCLSRDQNPPTEGATRFGFTPPRSRRPIPLRNQFKNLQPVGGSDDHAQSR